MSTISILSLLLLLVLHLSQQPLAFRPSATTNSIRTSSSSSSSCCFRLLAASSSSARPIVYDEPVFRPPAEWRSLILQVTIGCSWNRCTFCEMYQTKQYRVKPIEDIEAELQDVVVLRGPTAVRDVFLADGDAMNLPTKQLKRILKSIRQFFPKVRRISSYCLPRNIYGKSVDELSELQKAGLSLVYVGCESGSDVVLKAVDKGETLDGGVSIVYVGL